jgi:hypothetical protein
MRNLLLVAWLGLAGTLLGTDGPPKLGREIPDFALLDFHGRQHQLSRSDAKAIVLFFTANGCPIAPQSIRDEKRLQR